MGGGGEGEEGGEGGGEGGRGYETIHVLYQGERNDANFSFIAPSILE